MVQLTPGFSDNRKPTTSKLSSSVKRVVDWLQRFPLASFQIIEGIRCTTADREVRHTLGRVPNGFIVIDSDAGNAIYSTGKDKDRILLRANATTNIKIILF